MTITRDLSMAMRLLKHGRLADAASLIQHRVAELVPSQVPARSPSSPPPQAGQAQFLSRSFDGQAGARSYKLYIPSSYAGRPAPLIVMLHGCGQTPDEFAAATRMNQRAEGEGCLVAWPQQARGANMHRCWNWFEPSNQERGSGEPAIIAGITEAIMREYAVDATRLYVAGLSAGGALAAIMAQTYPDLYAAVGVHSGLACGAARDMKAALAAMANGGAGLHGTGPHRLVPTIIFHGDADTTVNPANADAVAAQALRDRGLRQRREAGQASGGHAYARTVWQDETGRVMVEQWRVERGGHAWFGGAQGGSYADPKPPDATQEMLRFFLQHRLTT